MEKIYSSYVRNTSLQSSRGAPTNIRGAWRSVLCLPWRLHRCGIVLLVIGFTAEMTLRELADFQESRGVWAGETALESRLVWAELASPHCDSHVTFAEQDQ